MRKVLALPLFFVFPGVMAQEKIVPAEARSFVLQGYSLLDYIAGDINGDGRPDALLLLKHPGEDSLDEDEVKRPLIVLTRDANGTLQQVLRNDSVVMCRYCGGVFGDPYSAASVSGDGFSIFFYGGSGWRWAHEYQFVYNPVKKNWYLFKETETSFQAGDPQMTMKEIIIEEAELGEISLDKFSSAPVFEDSRWMVKAVKTFFYDAPKLGSKPRKAYLVKGDEAKGFRQLTNFVELSFENKKGAITTGYILKKDLEKIN